MDNLTLKRKFALLHWVHTRHSAAAYVICVVAALIARRRLQRMDCVTLPGRELALHKQSVREEMLNDLSVVTSDGNVETIDGVDQLLSTNEVVAENFNNNEHGISMSAMPFPQERCHNITTSKGKKRKYDGEDIMTLKIINSLENVAAAIRKSNTILKESNDILERSRNVCMPRRKYIMNWSSWVWNQMSFVELIFSL